MFTHFQNVFVPILVAMNPLTVLPIYLSMTDGMEVPAMRTLANRAIFTAFSVAAIITVSGQIIFRGLGITVNDLRVGGGLILLILSIYDLLFSRVQRKTNEISTDSGVVPLGTPLIVGPATMTTCLILADGYGRRYVLIALVLNIAITWLLLYHAHRLKKAINPAVSKAFGKVMSLLLAAIAVAMIRVGATSWLHPQP